ncbi:hypothetical protein D041_0755B, partial [Vibrio parahaemolyticus EKP-008]
NYVASHDR